MLLTVRSGGRYQNYMPRFRGTALDAEQHLLFETS